MSRNLLFVLLLATGVALAEDAPEARRTDGASEAQAKKKENKARHADSAAKEEAEAKEDPDLGMSILGNQEAPKSLVIVPWKRSEIGNALGVSPMLDDSRQPIDKEVFMRALKYYEIRSETTHHDGARPGGKGAAGSQSEAAQPATATHGRKS